LTRLFFFTIVILFGELSLFAQDLIPNDSLTLVKLKVENPHKLPLEGQYLRIIDLETNSEFEVVTNEKGASDFLIPAKKDYKIIIETFYGKLVEVEMDLPDETNLTYEFDLTIGVSNELDISYKTNRYELDSSAYPNINQLLKWLDDNKKLSIEIRGHTDNVGSSSSNLLLSKNRAESVRKYLIGKGVNPSRIISKGLGETMPIEDNGSDKGRAENRRTEIIVKM
tara:strand:+ start:306 stop:980 length:675 start_codon:yes stop_codon:yes gene_type:complete